ncbi:hypothetical protein DFQ30_002566, partial [Apophysomyces sp. BC1015]
RPPHGPNGYRRAKQAAAMLPGAAAPCGEAGRAARPLHGPLRQPDSGRLMGLTDIDVKNKLRQCSLVPPIHVVKREEQQDHCMVHFDSASAAASFNDLYSRVNSVVCRQLPWLRVRPSQRDGAPVVYDRALVQPRLDGCRTRCKCNGPPPGDNVLKRYAEELEAEIAADEKRLAVKRQKLAYIYKAIECDQE